MVGVDAGGARVARAGTGADDALAVQGGAQPFVADVVLDDVGDRGVEQRVDRLSVVAEPRLDLVARRSVAEPCVAFGLPIAQRPTDAREQIGIGEVAVHVGGRQRRHRRSRALAVVPQRDRRAVFERAPEVRVGALHAVAVAGEIELVDDERMEQADEVGARADQPVGVGERLLEGARPPDLLTSLEHEDAMARTRQVGGGGEAVVPAADHDRVPGGPGRPPRRSPVRRGRRGRHRRGRHPRGGHRSGGRRGPPGSTCRSGSRRSGCPCPHRRR